MDRARTVGRRLGRVKRRTGTELAPVISMRAWALAALLSSLVVVSSAHAAPVAVRYVEGTSHGYVVLHDRRGAVLANGQLIQTVRGERLESRLFFHFADGSLYDETVTFTQHSVFRLVAYHLIQKGPEIGRASCREMTEI